MTTRHAHYEMCNGHMIQLHEPETGTETTIAEVHEETADIWESVTYVAEKAVDAKDIGGLLFDGMTIVVLRHEVPLPLLFLIAGLMLGLWMLRVQHRLNRARKAQK